MPQAPKAVGNAQALAMVLAKVNEQIDHLTKRLDLIEAAQARSYDKNELKQIRATAEQNAIRLRALQSCVDGNDEAINSLRSRYVGLRRAWRETKGLPPDDPALPDV